MDQVDYKQFLYKPNKNNSDEKPQFETRTIKKTKTKLPKNKKNLAYNIFVIMLIIIIGVLCTNFALNNAIYKKIKKQFEPETKNYYLVCQAKYDTELAYRSAYTIRSGGGSGYVYKENTEFFVVYSMFSDEKSANEVAKKNPDTVVKELSYEINNDEIINFCYKTIDELLVLAFDYENGILDESMLLGKINNQLTTLSEIKANYTKTNKNNNILLLTFFEENLNNIEIVNSQKVEILSSIRHITSALAINLKNYT